MKPDGKTDGGSAFPVQRMKHWTEFTDTHYAGQPEVYPCFDGGMSLRDYFAIRFAAATTSRECVSDFLTDEGLAGLAEESYKRADAMLSERSKP